MYLLYWHNKKKDKYYIIQLANGRIIINNLLEEELYCELKHRHEGDLNSGFVFSKDNNDFLCYSSESGKICIWNLYTKKLINKIKLLKCRLMHIIEWNYKYLIVADFDNKTFKVIDLEKKKNNIYDFHDKEGQHTSFVKSIKKIIHPIYGESLLTAGSDKKIKLWSFN
jgi:WD40 repeat protein